MNSPNDVSSLSKAFDPESFRREAHRLVDKLASHLAKAQAKQIPVLRWRPPFEAQKDWAEALENPNETLHSIFDRTIESAMHLHHPHYVGHQMSPCLPLTAICDLLTSTLNNSAAIYEMGPVGTMVERQVTRWMADALQLGPEADGIFTSGGTLANLTALLAARQRMLPGNSWLDGISGKPQPCVLVSEQSHYSIDRAVKIMGWGEPGIEKIPVDSRYKIRSETLEATYLKAKSQGKTVVAVVGNACSTATGSYDPLEEIHRFCQKHGLWFHVDGAHGATAALSPKYQDLVAGIGSADSVVWDVHKMMLAPALTSVVLFKQRLDSMKTFSQHATYLFTQSAETEWFNLSHRTLECTKRDFAFRFFVALKTYGKSLFIDYVERCYDLAREFAQEIQNSSDFELAVSPEANILCFRLKNKTNEFHRELRQKIIARGFFYLVQTSLPTGVYLRTTLMNPFTTIDDLRELLSEIRSMAITI